jgi:hypothetical protein
MNPLRASAGSTENNALSQQCIRHVAFFHGGAAMGKDMG